MLGLTPNKGWLIRKPDKLPQNAPAPIRGLESQTGFPRVHTVRQAIPGFSEKTPWIKGDHRAPARGQEEGRNENRRTRGM